MIVVNRAEVERLMVEKKITRNTLQKNYGFAYNTFDDVLSGNTNASMRSIEILCKALECQPSDILMKVKNV